MSFNSTIKSFDNITISWLLPSSGEHSIASYIVYYVYNVTANEVNTTEREFTLDGLSPGTNVTFTVRSFTACLIAGQEASIQTTTEEIREHISDTLPVYSYVTKSNSCFSALLNINNTTPT